MANESKNRQPYSLYFLILSMLIIGLSFWVIWHDTVKLRPWKMYQTQYNELKRQQMQGKYEKAMIEFNSPEVQQKYEELKNHLKEIERNFSDPETQKEYSANENKYNEIRELLRINKEQFQKVRGRYLELEYQYYKDQREEDKINLVILEDEVEELEKKREQLLSKEEILKEKLSEYTAEKNRITAEFQNLEKLFTDAKQNLQMLDETQIEIKQVFIQDINKADRCQSCHIGINEQPEITELQPFTSHTGHFVYLGNHNPEVFGCTICHRGQGRATTSPEKAHGWVKHWLEPMFNGYMIQATCQTCHGDIKHIRGADIINKGYELVEKYGCYGCHKIAGFEDLRRVGPNLTEVGTKVNYTWLIEWLKDPKKYFETARMPLFDFSQEEAEAVADYLFSITVEARVDYPEEEIDWELSGEGKIIWRQSRCNICHATNRIGGAHTKVYAPDLGKIGSKVSKDWLFNWIKDPKSYFPQTNMPRYRFTDDEIKALVEYLSSEYIDWDFIPNYIDPVQIKVESIEKGKEIIRKYGCFGCHNLKGMEEMKQIGPFLRRNEVTYLRASEVDDKIGAELSSIGNKAIDRFDFGKMKKEIPNDRVSYMKQKLREPKSYRDNLLMPDFQLPDEEIEALVTLLLGFSDINIPSRFKVPMNPIEYKPLGEFAKIVEDVKCLNCHSIRGVGNDFAPDLSIEGSKVQEQWLRDFIEKPDIIRPILKQMPQFKLDDKQKMIQGNLTYIEVETIVQYFKNVLVSDEIPEKLPDNGLDLTEQIEEGEKIYNEKGCIGCHQIEENGGVVGPNLTNVGNRLTEGYIFKHLENPQALIPNIIEPNYNFSEDERINLTRYLMSLINN